ncbi:MAG: reverse transcriptase domain-containing protein [Nitrosomonadaceae bacterium]
MKPKNYLSIGTFNVRGISQESKQQNLKHDMVKYGVDICALQETKIINGVDKNIDGFRLLSLKTNQKAYGNGFMISPKYNNCIHRHWKVSDRIAVLQLDMKGIINNGEPQQQYQSTLDGLKMKIQRKSPKHLFTIINVYAPTTQRVQANMKELDDMYSQLSELVNNFKNLASSMFVITGDLNAKVGKYSGLEKCLGQFSRGRRNNSGETLVNFCDINDLYISNSSFNHPARHITTCVKPYYDKTTNKNINSYTQIDYIILPRNKKQILQDARAYSGTELYSDHRLVVARFQTNLYKIYNNKTTYTQTTKRYNTDKLTNKTDIRDNYKETLTKSNNQEPQSEERWKRLKCIITTTANDNLGFQEPRRRDNKIHDDEVEELSQQSKNLRVKLQNTSDPAKTKHLKSLRNKKSHEIRSKIKQKHEERLKQVINEIESADNNTKMFTAVKNLHRRSEKTLSVHDNEGKSVTSPNAVCEIITEHFSNHFHKHDTPPIDFYTIVHSKMTHPISTEEVRQAVSRMSNNRAPGFDNISVKLIKYAPDDILTEISRVLTDAIETNKDIDTGIGLIAPLEKPAKPMPGPAKNLRPITLLAVLRKILSKVTLSRLKPKIEQYLSQSQSAYRPNRSTTDIVWAYRWILAKVQEYHIEIFVTGIDMSAAFDTIDRHQLLQILETFADNDEMRMTHFLLNNTTLQVKMKGATTAKTFTSNVGSPQGDGLSGPLFTTYLEHALRELREAIQDPPEQDHNYAVNNQGIHIHPNAKSPLPSEMIYADDADFLTDKKWKQQQLNNIIPDILSNHNLIMNADKTELLILKRGNRDNEIWRQSKKVGSLLGDIEDICRRKQLAISALKSMQKVWLQKYKRISLQTRLKLFEALVLSILLYNCSCWGLRKVDEDQLDSFHRRLLRKICNIRWPNTISNHKLYRITKTKPLMVTITRARWRYLGHVLRMDAKSPPREAMKYYFNAPVDQKKFSGQRRATIFTTLQRDISNTKHKFPHFQIHTLQSSADLDAIQTLALDRQTWKRITKSITDTVEANRLDLR